MTDATGGEASLPANLGDVSWRILPLWTSLDAAAGFELPERSLVRFRDVHSHLTQVPRPALLSRLEPQADGKRNWYRRLTARILDNVQEGIGACHYHLANIAEIESELHQIVRESVPRLGLPTHTPYTVGGGNTRRLNYEYQAFVLAARRTMDYFAGSVAAFFKEEDPSLGKLARCIRRSEPQEQRESVLAVLHEHEDLVAEVLSQPPRMTVRDQVAHYQPVQAGTLNLIFNPAAEPSFHVGLMGGGEELLTFDTLDGDPRLALTDALRRLLDRIERLIFESYAAMGIASADDV